MNGWISGATGLALGALPVAAQAGLEVCNDTDLRQSVAIGYEAPGGADLLQRHRHAGHRGHRLQG